MIVAIANGKGGTSKTTTAMWLATAAVRHGQDVMVYDADPQGSASLWADTASDKGRPLPFEVGTLNVSQLRRLRDEKGVLKVVDCPPQGQGLTAAIAAATFVLVPTDPYVTALQQTWETCDYLEERKVAYRVLLTRYRIGTVASRTAAQELINSEVPHLDAFVPLTEEVGNSFGRMPGKNLHGYEDVYEELAGIWAASGGESGGEDG